MQGPFSGKNHDLGGGMIVTRILPHINKRTVGPFVFLDHMGPVTELPNQNTDVRAHPHIGLSTLTYLFDGRIVHRDSTGALATIEPGEVNWMTAGSGISHSERAHPDDKFKTRTLHGLQFWIALPENLEECEPSFIHYDKSNIPMIRQQGMEIKLIAGTLFNQTSPVKVSSPLLFCEVKASSFSVLNISEENFGFTNDVPFEIALYVIKGEILISDKIVKERQFYMLNKTESADIKMNKGNHFVLIGGIPLETKRHLFWNFVSSNKERIELAKKQWQEGTFPMVPGETERIPLPQ